MGMSTSSRRSRIASAATDTNTGLNKMSSENMSGKASLFTLCSMTFSTNVTSKATVEIPTPAKMLDYIFLSVACELVYNRTGIELPAIRNRETADQADQEVTMLKLHSTRTECLFLRICHQRKLLTVFEEIKRLFKECEPGSNREMNGFETSFPSMKL